MTSGHTRELADRLGIRVVAHGVVDSTMTRALEDPGPAPALHLAARQTAGRGRGESRWEGPEGNLYATIRWLEGRDSFPSGLLASIQVEWARTVSRMGGPTVRCKWPNDGWLAGSKWAGLLARRPSTHPGEIHLGLGANLEAAPAGVDAPTTHLSMHWPGWPGYAVVAEALLRGTLAVLVAGPTAVRERLREWPLHDAFSPGEPLVVDLPDGPRAGVYRGIDADGRLRLETPGGETVLASGEARRVRRA